MKRLTSKVTPERARTHNTQLVLKAIYESGQISRADIARQVGLTRPSVSAVVADLIEQGLVEEIGYAPSTGGKRPLLLGVMDDSRHLIGLNLARESFGGAVINLRGKVVHRIEVPLDGRDGDDALALVYDIVTALVDAASSPLLGIGIGAPGLVDAVNGVLYEAVNLDWHNVPLGSLLSDRYDLPVYMANDCQVAALAEHTFGDSGGSTKDLVVINVGWGVGAGIVYDGALLHGNPLGAGEIGHVVVAENGVRCQCGNYGCLETVISTWSIVRRARSIASSDSGSLLYTFSDRPQEISFDTVYQMFAAGDQAVRQMVYEVGQALGIAAANLVGVLGSCRILISGRITCFGPFLLDAMRQEMSRRCLPSQARDTEIGFTSVGTDIVLLGASVLLLHNELGLFVTS